MRKKIPAFALIEIAIALSVFGIIGYMTMPLLGKIQRWQKARTSHAHQEKIIEALAGYVLANKRLPCPAADSNGQALAVCTNATKTGFVPYRTLGIDQKIAKDGNHHWITYVVQPNLTATRINWIQPEADLAVDPKTVFCKTPGDAAFAIQNEKHEPCIMAPDFVAVVLIAHGESGGYALDNGAIQPVTSSDTDKIANAARGNIFTTKTQCVSSAVFDDMVLFVSRNNLMAQWGKFPCRR